MTLQHVDIVFQLIVFLFAISFHESAHAWMANRCGDPTARMLGRITLNPIKHIDPFGTILLPLVAMISGFPVLGWAKPTPVDPNNFRNKVRDDILTSVVGPISNFSVASAALVVLAIVSRTSATGSDLVHRIPFTGPAELDALAAETKSILLPISLLLYDFMLINIVLGVFNLIPLPPLDGSHVLRHFLPQPALRVYDAVGWVGLMALVFLAPRFLDILIGPVVNLFRLALFKT